jgi:DNA mismatch repair protein MutS
MSGADPQAGVSSSDEAERREARGPAVGGSSVDDAGIVAAAGIVNAAGIAHARGWRFRSVLFAGSEAGAEVAEQVPEPDYFGDLNLDLVCEAIAARRKPYRLEPFLRTPLDDPEAIRFRQEIFQDLERPEIHTLATAFAEREVVAHDRAARRALSEQEGGFGHFHRARSFLNTVLSYCETVERLASGLADAGVRSGGLLGLCGHLAGYLSGGPYRTLRDQARALDQELDQVRYSILLRGARITVGPYDELAPDYSAQVLATFDRFRQGTEGRELPVFNDRESYSAIGVLHLVAKLYPELFGRLERFCRQHSDYLDPVIAALDRELQFYLGYLDHIRPLREAGLSFSYPLISAEEKSMQALDTFDLALAARRIAEHGEVVCNDVRLDGPERILVVSGPNNGGKTTLARTVGQLHHLARLGCPIPGRETRIFVCDRIFTRFERREDMTTLSGKLQDELNRLRDALEAASGSSLFILNEMFSSTSAQDALLLSREILRRIGELDALCVCVTFLDELASFDHTTVSMVAEVDADDPARRTFRVVRRAADGRAYARALAERYGLTYQQLIGRERR